MGIVLDAQDVIFVADNVNHCVRLVAPGDGAVTTLVGVGGEKAFADGQRATTRFNEPCGLALDVDCNLILADVVNNCIHQVTTAEGRVQQWQAVRDTGDLLMMRAKPHALIPRMVSQWMMTVSGSSNAGSLDGACACINAPMSLTLDEGG